MKFWVIRHKPSGMLLPELMKKRKSGGYTWTEPSNDPPRLFSRYHDANVALTWWLRGVTTMRMRRVDSLDGPDDFEDWETVSRPERKNEDMEILPMELVPFCSDTGVLRNLVDLTWQFAMEDKSVPSTEDADKLIERALKGEKCK